MKPLVATVVSIQEEPGDRYHATVTIVLPGDIEHVELMLEDICADADASALSDTDPGTHSIGISGSGKPPREDLECQATQGRTGTICLGDFVGKRERQRSGG